MDTTTILILTQALDFDTLISFYQVSKDTICILDSKEGLTSLSTRYNLEPSKCFWQFVRGYACKYPCMRSFLYLEPTEVAIMAAKALDYDMIEESLRRKVSDIELVIRVAIKASLHDDKESIHPTIIRMFDKGIYPYYIKYAYCYGGKSMGDYFAKLAAIDNVSTIVDIMYFACRGGLLDFVKSNVEHGRTHQGHLSEYLEPACKGRHREIIDYLLSKGASFVVLDFCGGDSLGSTIRFGFLDLVVKVHEMKKHKGHNINYKHYIALADRKGYTEISNYLKSCM